MLVKFTPDPEAKFGRRLLKEGEVSFTITEVIGSGKTEKGAEYISFKFDMTDSENFKTTRKELVWTDHNLFNLLKSVGLEAKYNEGSLNADDLLKLSGKCMVVRSKYDGDYGESYKNKIVMYLPKSGESSVSPLVEEEVLF